ncbi:MAG: D-aminoacylase [Verrucomicrobiaceae bacterium]|nr:D-aminoacylase [Verrucomicrobiaceae bacterium]
MTSFPTRFPSLAGLAALAFFSLFCTGPATAENWDVVIVNGRVVDGTGGPARPAQIAVKEGRVAAIAEDVGPGRTVIDAAGKVVAPGFIDVHTHSENLPKLPVAENFLRMGVTTIVTGNCGSSKTDVAAFFKDLEELGISLNVATLIGHNSVRRRAMGGSLLRPPSPDQLAEMERLVDQAMREGAVGLSTGLIYVPGTYAKTDEVLALARAAAAHDGIYVIHMRHETAKIFEAIDELLTIARTAEIRAHISHIKLNGPTAWGQADRVLALLDEARAGGLAITHDQYAYDASSTGLAQMIPSETREGTRDDYLARIADPAEKAEIIEEMKRMREALGQKDYTYAVIARYRHDPELNGLTIPEAAKLRRGSDAIEEQVELILQIHAEGGGSAVYHGMNEADLKIFMAHPSTMVASDGGPRRLGEDLPHPRSYGNNARVLGRYVREQGVVDLEEAVRKMTSLPATVFQLKDRGELRPGAVADIVVFDPEAVSDPATFKDPHRYAVGFSDVLVNGVPVIADGKLQEVRPGRSVRRGE